MAALLGLLFALVPAQDPAPAEPELARYLFEDVRGWLRAEELPAPEDLEALLAEAHDLPPDADLARELGDLGHRLGQAGREEEARALVAWVGESAGAAGDLATQSWAFEWLGQRAWVRDELDAAAEWIARAAEADARRRAGLDRTRHLADVARIRLTQGRFEEARAAIDSTEEAARSAGTSEARRAAAEIHGSFLFQLGRHREALALCTEAAGTDEQPDETQVRLEILVSDILADVGRLEAAASHARRALETALELARAGAAPLLHLEAELSLGLLLGDLSRCDEALALLDQAAAEFARLGDARGAAWTDKNRGFTLFAARRYREALPAFERAWHAGEELGVPVLAGLGALGVAEALVFGGSTGDERMPGALAAAEGLARELHDRQLEWRCAALRGRIALERGQFEPALASLRRAVVLIERWRRRLGASGLVEHALRQRSDPYRDAAFAAAHLGRMEEALGFAELLQARVLDELRARRDGPLVVPSSPAIEDLRERIARLESELERANEEQRAGQERELERAEDELDAALLANEISGGRALDPPGRPLAPERLGPALERQGFARALVYLVGDAETLALEVAAGAPARVEGHFLSIGRARMTECIERLRAPIARLEEGELDLAHLGFDAGAARALHEALVAPLALPAGARVALVADELLQTIPFELLVSGGEPGPFDFARPFAHLAGLRFLADELVLVSFGSLASLTCSTAERAGDAVLFLAPETAGLPRAAEEVRGIASTLGAARVVAGARPEDVSRAVAGAAVVHFAAHGRLDPERPAHGHLVLGAASDGASARFEGWQASELALDGALVVLASCHSGRGEWRPGAGLAGLTRGFLLGGAREVVASHWAVDDRVTARFMELFYAALAQSHDAAGALQAARTKLRAEDDPRGFSLAHPAFWSAWFVQR